MENTITEEQKNMETLMNTLEGTIDNYAKEHKPPLVLILGMLDLIKYNITVNTIILGYFSIGMIDDVPLEMQRRLLDNTPMKRFGNPNELCSLVYYLSSKDAAYITGQTIGINGGYYM